MLLSITHTTHYHYAQPVRFGPHRLMVRAIEGHDVQIRGSKLAISVPHRLRWLQDVFGNSVAVLELLEESADLQIECQLKVEQFNTNPFNFVLDEYACQLPFQYPPDEARDTAPFLQIHHPADEAAVRNWVRPFLDVNGRAKTLEFFLALSRSVPLFFQYTRREEPGVQTPGETLRQRSGSCRDFALLFMEAARIMGVAARFVSGYLCRGETDETAGIATDSTHAWAEIYLPGAGWKGFDPTSGILAADLHVRTAVTRDPVQAIPIAGSFIGNPSLFRGMEVTVNAHALKPEGT